MRGKDVTRPGTAVMMTTVSPTPVARTRSSTSLGPIFGTGTVSSRSGAPSSRRTIAFIVSPCRMAASTSQSVPHLGARVDLEGLAHSAIPSSVPAGGSVLRGAQSTTTRPTDATGALASSCSADYAASSFGSVTHTLDERRPMRSIDVHAHLTPQCFWQATERGDWHTLRREKDARGQECAIVGGKRQVLPPRARWTPEERLADMD